MISPRFNAAEYERLRQRSREASFVVLIERPDGTMHPLYFGQPGRECDDMPNPALAARAWALTFGCYVQIWKLPENLCVASAFPFPEND